MMQNYLLPTTFSNDTFFSKYLRTISNLMWNETRSKIWWKAKIDPTVRFDSRNESRTAAVEVRMDLLSGDKFDGVHGLPGQPVHAFVRNISVSIWIT
jgi:hypothetical protein